MSGQVRNFFIHSGDSLMAVMHFCNENDWLIIGVWRNMATSLVQRNIDSYRFLSHILHSGILNSVLG